MRYITGVKKLTKAPVKKIGSRNLPIPKSNHTRFNDEYTLVDLDGPESLDTPISEISSKVNANKLIGSSHTSKEITFIDLDADDESGAKGMRSTIGSRDNSCPRTKETVLSSDEKRSNKITFIDLDAEDNKISSNHFSNIKDKSLKFIDLDKENSQIGCHDDCCSSEDEVEMPEDPYSAINSYVNMKYKGNERNIHDHLKVLRARNIVQRMVGDNLGLRVDSLSEDQARKIDSDMKTFKNSFSLGKPVESKDLKILVSGCCATHKEMGKFIKDMSDVGEYCDISKKYGLKSVLLSKESTEKVKEHVSKF